jgi:N utilization substance protein B
MPGRSRAREIVLQLLYRDDLNDDHDDEPDRQFLRGRLSGDLRLAEFAESILRGVRQQREHLDRMLARSTAHWSIRRMAVTDRNILRMAAWEIRYGDTPDRVAINEAIELAKRYGDADSSRFVNGVLDRLIRTPHVRQSLDALIESEATDVGESGST